MPYHKQKYSPFGLFTISFYFQLLDLNIPILLIYESQFRMRTIWFQVPLLSAEFKVPSLV